MRIAIYGTGAVGGYFGARLAQSGHDVWFIARGEHLRAIRDGGLAVESVRGDFVVHPAQATDEPSTIGPVDAVLLGVKSWQVREACAAAAGMLGPETAVVTLQNGVEAPHHAAAAVGRERVLAGLVKVFAQVAGPGRIRHTGPERIAFAEWDNAPSERVRRLRSALAEAGVTVDAPTDIWAALWEKFLFVVPMGGIGAVARAPVGAIRGVPETRAMLEAAMREILGVAHAHGVALPADVVDRTMAFVDTLPAAGTSSLQRDIAAGRPSELEAWSGAVARLGREAGVGTPVHAFIHHALLPLERRARGELHFDD
ncbi:MAG: 2-dehydropantoate 2-reductase [Gemmatimonadetes bacterium]|nr:2-dehydropantoate 2-reductase [Gemmatimonadota bacterium]